MSSSSESESESIKKMSIEEIHKRYRLLAGKSYPGFIPPPPPPPKPTSSFKVPQRPSKPKPCIILPHPLIPGVYVSGDHYDHDHYESLFLYTKNLVPGVQSFDQDEVVFSVQDDEDGGTVEYREWDPYKSRLAAAILSGAQNIWIKPCSRVLVTNIRDDAQFGITISHISDIVGPQGLVYVVDESNGKSLLDMADKRFNIVPIVFSSAAPHLYRMLINLVDVLFVGLDRPEEGLRAHLNAMYFLKTGGHYMLYAQGNCIESTNQGDGLLSYLRKRDQVQFQRMERVTLEPFDRDHAYVSGVFRMLEIAKIDQRCLASHEFWTSEYLPRGERPISLYEKTKNLPAYMLFESSCGYLVFQAHDVNKVERNYVATEEYIERFDEFFQLVACHTFVSSDEALKYLTADGNATTPENLIEFLVQHLPPGKKDGEHCFTLALLNPSSMAYGIISRAKISCQTSPFHVDIIRGVRMNIEKFFKNMKPGDLEKAQVDLARNYSRQKLDSPDKGKLPKKRCASLGTFPTRRNPKRKVRAGRYQN